MKKKLLFLTFLAGSITSFGQVAQEFQPANGNGLKARRTASSGERTFTCIDTVRYAETKEALLGSPQTAQQQGTFYTYLMKQAEGMRFSHAFLLTGSSVNISGVEFYGRNIYRPNAATPLGTSSITVSASIFNVDADKLPTGTALTTESTTFSDTVNRYRYVNFSTPLTVSANYAIVIEVTSAGGVYSTFLNNVARTTSYDEALAGISLTAPIPNGGTGGVFYPVSAAFSTQTAPADFEPLFSPIISYNIVASATATPDPSCIGTAVTFSGTATPATVLSNHMFNWNVFLDHFNLVTADRTFEWDMTPSGTATTVGTASHDYTYTTAAAHTAEFSVEGGFSSTCIDVTNVAITVNALPVVTAGADVAICPGASTTLDAGGAVSYSWNNGVGAGETVTVTPTVATTYTVTGTDANGCQGTDAVAVSLNALDDASFSYTSNTICNGGANVTPTAALAGGTYSSTAGLDIDAATGEIDATASTLGTYTVTYSVDELCANTSTQTITITDAPEAGFSYANPTYCAGSANPTPTFDAGASAGVFSSTTGLSINASTGVINIAASTAGTYTVTNTIAASGSCPAATETATVTINAIPTATVSGGGNICGTGTSTVTITLTGTAPYDFTYTDGTTPVTVTGNATATYTINATAAGTYTVTTVEDAVCSNQGTGSAQVTVSTNPTVALAALPTVCSNGTAVALTQGTPAGGTYSGTGITGASFTPSVAGPVTVTYNYTDANGCSGSATGTITVNAAPTVTLAALSTVCTYNAAFALSGGAPAGGTYSGTGVTAGNFNPATAGVGTHNIVYSYTATGCTATATKTIVVDACAGVEENEFANNLVIYPNPANGSVFVSFSTADATVATITLISNDGKVVSVNEIPQTNEFNQEINLTNLASGIYTIQIQTQKGATNKKLIVQ